MYRENKYLRNRSGLRRKSVNLDGMIKLNKSEKVQTLDMSEPMFKTSLGIRFLNLFAKQY
jgi:hypothetical protein